MAYYDPTTDSIVGADHGSYAYFHESRHREQYQRGVAEKVDSVNVICYYAAFISGPVGWYHLGVWGWFIGIGMAMTGPILGLAALELDAYIIGTWRWLRSR